MAERKEKEEAKVADFTEVFKGLSGLVKDNYLSNLKIVLSIWEENQRLANAQIDHFLTTQKEYAEQLKAASERFLPKEVVSFWNGGYSKVLYGNFDRLAEIQREYINLARSTSERFTKEAINLSQKTAEKTFSVFEEYLKAL
ncbi:MAG: hypothetical protein C4291_03300 [Candidatus Dadabacteria bacterium]